MNCTEARSLFSLYLDGAVTGRQMAEIDEHRKNCSSCAYQYYLLSQTQKAVASVGRRQPPPDLALRIRVALSHEVARKNRPIFEGLASKLDDALRVVMVPATAGVLSTIIFLALLVGFFAVPTTVEARADIPTVLNTQPELTSTPFGWQSSAIDADSVVVDVSVDANGRVQDYRIISAPSESNEIMNQLNRMLIFTQFRPATSFGKPVAGRALLSFSKINVKG